MTAYTEVDYAGEEESRKSTSGIIVLVGGVPVMWKSKLQRVVALSTTEAELMATVEGCREGIWLKKVIADIFGNNSDGIIVQVDNQITLKVIRNQLIKL